MQRVVITGMGIVSCLGNNQQEVLESLKAGKSGIRTDQSHIDKQFRSQISGVPQIDLDALIDRKLKRFMGDGAAYAYLSMKEAIEQAGLTQEQVSSLRTGLIAGAGGHSPRNEYDAVKTLEERGLRRVGPYMVPRVMASSISAMTALCGPWSNAIGSAPPPPDCAAPITSVGPSPRASVSWKVSSTAEPLVPAISMRSG